jgi:hypothetical protein
MNGRNRPVGAGACGADVLARPVEARSRAYPHWFSKSLVSWHQPRYTPARVRITRPRDTQVGYPKGERDRGDREALQPRHMEVSGT